MAIVLEGHIKVPVDELETIKNNLNEHIQNTKVPTNIPSQLQERSLAFHCSVGLHYGIGLRP